MVNCNKENLDRVKKLGHGSFGQVFLMRHKELDVLFAVKQIRDSMNDTESECSTSQIHAVFIYFFQFNSKNKKHFSLLTLF